jgi:hypothetical protein
MAQLKDPADQERFVRAGANCFFNKLTNRNKKLTGIKTGNSYEVH